MDHNCKKCLLRSDQVVSTERIQLLTQYIPYKLVRFIGETKCCIYDHKIEELEGSVIYFDIIGFTHIIVDYIEANRDIAELSNTFSDFYSVIIETIREFGGSVFQFAGDSIFKSPDSIAGYKTSSIILFNRWISSIKTISRGERFVKMEARSPTFSIAGPDVIFICLFVSFAIRLASVVFPSPGRPSKSLCSAGWSLSSAA